MYHFLARSRSALCLLLLLVLAACNFPLFQTAGSEPTAEPAATEAATDVPTDIVTVAAVDFPVFEEPEAGTPMLWVDNSMVVYVPGGEFLMGFNEVNDSDHQPEHTVTLDGFWIYQAEVTNQMYASCVELGVCSAPDLTDNEWYNNPEFVNAPVTGVTWQQAGTYCEWVEARLPTEAEWEKAGRGTDTATYPWGEDEPTCDLLNYEDCLDHNQPQPVRSYMLGASPYDLADMGGNAAEWVYDWYGEEYYTVSPAASPTGPDTGTERVVRGSSFNTSDDELEIYLRDALDPLETHEDLGFRCVLTGDVVNRTPVVPMCTTVSYSPNSPDFHPAVPQAPVPSATLDFYCNTDGDGDPFLSMAVRLPEGTDLTGIMVESNYGSLFCVADPGGTSVLSCVGAGLHLGTEMQISVCPALIEPPSIGVPACPQYYRLNSETHLCEYRGTSVMGGCEAPYVAVPGYECLGIPDVFGQCPLGLYVAHYEGRAVCVPSSGGNYCSPTTGACTAFCPEGLTFNPTEICCDYPADVAPVCPEGFVLNESIGGCISEPIQVQCAIFDVLGPVCTSIPTAPPDTQTQTGCMVYGPNGTWYCEDPCQPGHTGTACSTH